MKKHYIEIDPEHPDKILLDDWDQRFREVYGSIPTSSYKRKRDVWHFNLNWQVVLAISNTLKNAQLEVGPELKKWTNDTYEQLIKPAYDMKYQTDAEGYEGLFPHQKADVQFLAHIKRGILANDLGVGKTRSAIASVMRLHEKGETVFPVLVVCPNSTKIGWGREIEEMWPGAKVVVVDGTVTKRRKQLAEPAHFYVMNWEALAGHSRLAPYGSIELKRCEACGGGKKVSATSCETHTKELNTMDFGTIIGDEIHRIVDPKTKTARALKAATGSTPIRFGLTATPISNDVSNIYSILNWLFPEAYPSKSAFISRYCETMPQAWGQDIITGLREDRKQEFYQGLDPFLRRMTKEVILPFLPPIVREERLFTLSKKERDAYNAMVKKQLYELESGDVIVATSPLRRAQRVQQFCSSYAEVEYMEVPDPKTNEIMEKAVVKLSEPSSALSAFMDDVPDFGEESVIVFAQSKQLLYLLAERFNKAGIHYGMITGDQNAEERQYWMDAFQAGDVQFILVTVQAGGTGITLTRASIMVYLQRPFSLINNQQSEGRGHRIGSEIHDFVRIIDYVAVDTKQKEVVEALQRKGENLQEILRDDDLVEILKGSDN